MIHHSLSFPFRKSRHGLPARISSLMMMLQRSPVLPLLPEARVISTSGVGELLGWTITAVAGLGAFDSVSGNSAVSQVLPTSMSPTVNAVAGDPLNFVFQLTGEPSYIPGAFQVVGTLPAGLVQTALKNSTTDSITGTPSVAGNFPITLYAWQTATFGVGFFAHSSLTIKVTLPPVPTVTAHPAGGNFSAGAFVNLTAGNTNGRTFTWKLDDQPLQNSLSILFPRAGARKFIVAPAADPGDGWRGGGAFSDSSWTSASGGIGYDTAPSPVNYGPSYVAPGVDVTSLLSGSGKPVAVHLRLPFTLSGPAPLSYLGLRVQCDDGFVAWLNGTEVASQNKPASFLWNSAASAEALDTTAVTFREIDISAFLGSLRQGGNLLAVQAMNRSNSSPDFLFNAELVGGINATNSTRLILPSLQTAQTGTYTLTVANPAGSAKSKDASVLEVPTILTPPASVGIQSGATTTLEVTPAGTAPFTYQWYRGAAGVTTDPVSGATAASFTTPALSQTTSFWVRVTNAASTVDSDVVTVTVTTADPFTLWKAEHFSAADAGNASISGPDADPDFDGLTNGQEYVFGTLPGQSDAPALTVTLVEGHPVVSFTAVAAAGPGYTGLTRLYTLESTTDLSTGPWTSVTGFTGLTATGQTVTFTPPAGAQTFLRLKALLTP